MNGLPPDEAARMKKLTYYSHRLAKEADDLTAGILGSTLGHHASQLTMTINGSMQATPMYAAVFNAIYSDLLTRQFHAEQVEKGKL